MSVLAFLVKQQKGEDCATFSHPMPRPEIHHPTPSTPPYSPRLGNLRECVCVCGGVITKVAAGGFPLCPHLDLIVAPVACGKPGHREQGFLDDLKVHSTHWLCK